jgi:hypothetical protein
MDAGVHDDPRRAEQRRLHGPDPAEGVVLVGPDLARQPLGVVRPALHIGRVLGELLVERRLVATGAAEHRAL